MIAGFSNIHEVLSQNLPLERFSFKRVMGYSFHAAWVLSIFYSVFFYTSTDDLRYALYANQLVSQLSLVLSVLLFVIFAKLLSKYILSKAMVFAATIALAVSTIILIFVNTATMNGFALTIISAILSGISSAMMFLGWVKLFTDGGAKIAVVELTLAYIIAALFALVLQYLPGMASCIVTALFAIGSGLLLRISSLDRQKRLAPPTPRPRASSYKKRLYRGAFAVCCLGAVTGFCDLLSGFGPFNVGDFYGNILLAGILVLTTISLLTAMFCSKNAITYINRIALLAVIIGCFLLAFMNDGMTYQYALVMGGYISFFIAAVTIAIDISNYYEVSATKIVGGTLLTLFIGEFIGYTTGYIAGTYDFIIFPIETIAFVLCGLLLAINLFLFTEKDMLETQVGELFNNDGECVRSTIELKAQNARDWTDAIAQKLTKEFKLSVRESEVLPLVLRGRTIARIQESLHISAATVHTHIRHIYTKAGVTNRQELLDIVENEKLAMSSNGSKDVETTGDIVRTTP